LGTGKWAGLGHDNKVLGHGPKSLALTLALLFNQPYLRNSRLYGKAVIGLSVVRSFVMDVL